MLIKRFMVAVLLLMAPGVQSQAQNAPLGGEWLLEKVDLKLYAQAGSALLEERTVTTQQEFNAINGYLPRTIQFQDGAYHIRLNNSEENGTYEISTDSVLSFRQQGIQPSSQPALPPMTLKYSFPEATLLRLPMPATYYKDNTRNLAVKLAYTCYYRRKSF